MDMQTIAVIAATIGALTTIVFVAIGILGVRALREIRDQVRQHRS